MQLLESYELCDINKACMALRDNGTINKPVYTQPITDKVKPIVEEVEATGGTEQQNFLLSRVSELLTGGNELGTSNKGIPTAFISPFGMHDPALLNLEAYDFLLKRDRYSQPEVTP